jgi:hypothetical protein
MDPATSTTAYRVLASATLAWARFNRAVDRAQTAAQQAASGFLGSALTTSELQDLCVRLYGAAPGEYAAKRGLETWEEAWYDASLPAPPATVLVTAAGSGREAAALVARGYTVDALEPEPGFAAACAALPGVRHVVASGHDELARAVLDGAGGPAVVFSGRSYDAVIIGWGSFTHVLDQTSRLRLVETASRLAPAGPVLLSFFAAGPHRPPRSRAGSLGRLAGSRVARLRRTMPGAGPDDRIFWHLGFTHSFSPDEIEVLALASGRRSDYQASPYGHATLSTAAEG